jgi:nucleoside phosphorylase
MILFSTAHSLEYMTAITHLGLEKESKESKFCIAGSSQFAVIRSGSRTLDIESSLRSFLKKYNQVSLIIDTGCCGSLNTTIPQGTLVTAKKILNTEGRDSGVFPALHDFSLNNFIPVDVLNVDVPVCNGIERDRLADLFKAQVCNMEILSIGIVAVSLGLPFVSFRVVTDQCDSSFSKEYLTLAHPHLICLYSALKDNIDRFS